MVQRKLSLQVSLALGTCDTRSQRPILAQWHWWHGRTVLWIQRTTRLHDVFVEMVVNNRFIFLNNTAIIADYKFYHIHTAEIDQWLETHNCSRQGMVIDFADSHASTMFALRWA